MRIITERQAVERLQFFTGQRLFASDVQAIEAFNREMRWLHNQSLHQPGIGLGYSISGEVGDREVSVAPGYAIDSQGREIVHTQESILHIPPIADDGFGNPVNYDLAISYPDDSLLEEAKTIEKIQLPNSALRFREEPVFHWVELDQNLQPKDDKLKVDIKNGLKIVLRRFAVQNCRIGRIYIDLKLRKAHPEKLPRIFAGRTDPQTTEWEFWKETYSGTYGYEVKVTLGLKAFVDTSSAKFDYPPRYFARVVGKRFFNIHGIAPEGFLLEGFVNITKAEETPFERGLELRILMPHIDKLHDYPIEINPHGFFKHYSENNKVEELRQDLNWHIVWMGIED